MAHDPDDDDEVVIDAPDEEALADEEPAELRLANATGLGVDLPEADVLDQRREVGLDDEDEER